jgi:alpha-L-fucosidase
MSKHLMKRVNDSRRIGRKALLTIGLVSAGLFFGAQSATAEEANAHAEYMKMKVGFFVHYVWGGAYTVTVNRDGSKPLGLDDLANRFDAEGLAQDLSSMGVEYVLFTAWHASMNLLYPSAVMDRWIPGHSAKRDVIRDLIKACHARNIRVLLYTHPRDGHDLSPEDQTKTGWAGSGTPNPDWAKFDKQKWNDFINEVYGELVERYGSDLIGLYLDEGSGAADSHRVIDYARLRKTITDKHPQLMLMQNDYGNLYTLDIGNKEIYYGKEFATPESDTWPSMRLPISIVMGSIFWAGHAAGSSVVAQPSPKVGFNARVPYTAEGMFRYNVLQAAAVRRL